MDVHEKGVWKVEAKQVKAEYKRKAKEQRGRPGSDDSICGEQRDEVDILEKLPRKHQRDTKKLLDQWIWDFGSDRHSKQRKIREIALTPDTHEPISLPF